MLSDNIAGAINTAGRMVLTVARWALRGALIGGALLVGAAMVGGAVAATGGIGAAVLGAGHALAATFLSSQGLSALGAAAELGAIVFGVASLIPGVSDLWSGAKKAVKPREQEEVYTPPAAEQSRAPARDMENPYYETGKGARLMNRGDAAAVQGTGACR